MESESRGRASAPEDTRGLAGENPESPIDTLFGVRGREGSAPVPLEDVTVFVDEREPKEILRYLEGKTRYEVRMLQDEDYLIGDVHITRKQTLDLFRSLASGHVQDELNRLLLHSNNIVFISEHGPNVGWQQEAMLSGYLRHLNEIVPVFRTKSLEDTANLLLSIRKEVLEGTFAVSKRLPVVYGHVNPVVRLYMAFPGIGLKRAETLARVYPRPMELFLKINDTYEYKKERWKTMKKWREERWDSKVDGIGEDTVEKVASYLLDGIELGGENADSD